MFLVTTAIEESWKREEEIVFLGRWCMLYDRKDIWRVLNYKIVKYHWDDRKKLFNDFKYLDNLYEKYLTQLSSILNDLLFEKQSVEYWRLLLGPWLKHFINILFDRYLSLLDAKRDFQINSTIIVENKQKDWLPLDFKEFSLIFTTDEYNHYLYGEIIKKLDLFPFEVINAKKSETGEELKQKSPFSYKQKLISTVFSNLPSRFKSIIFLNSGFNKSDSSKLLKSLGQWPYELNWSHRVDLKQKNETLRNRICFGATENEFESLLNKILPIQIPYAYLEDHALIQQKTLQFKSNPQIIFTVSGARYNDDECFKMWAGKNKEKGTKIILGQHGGNFGTARFCDSEIHQIKVSDNYFTWGWRKKETQKVIPMPSPKLQYASQNIKTDPNGDFAWLLNEGRRYAYRLASFPIASQWEDYFEDQVTFFNKCTPEVQKKLLLRPHPKASHGWSAVKRIKDGANENVRIVPTGTSMYDQLNNSSLCICTFNTTAHLEALAANFPTLLFWNPNHWEIRDEAVAVHEELKEVGILWHTPEEAAQMLNSIYKDITHWWMSSKVQNAREHFVKSFAYKSEAMIHKYHDLFEKEYKSQSQK